LAGIAGASSALARANSSLDEHTRAELLRTIHEESERLSRLVDNLLQMTRLSSGKVAIDLQWHPVEEIVGSTLTRMERQLGDHAIDIRIDADVGMVRVDAILLEQLLVNLVDNAAKYSPEDGPIEVSARRSGDAVELEVADRGRGFADGDEQRVFDLFYRGTSTKPDRWGTGIGLAICRAIAEAHRGRIDARNRPGGGAAVRVSIPQSEPPPQLDLHVAELQLR
jgi:two-component system sensor histidine kinase KdpD